MGIIAGINIYINNSSPAFVPEDDSRNGKERIRKAWKTMRRRARERKNASEKTLSRYRLDHDGQAALWPHKGNRELAGIACYRFPHLPGNERHAAPFI